MNETNATQAHEEFASWYQYRISREPVNGQYVGTCDQFDFICWIDSTPDAALSGIRRLIADEVQQMLDAGEQPPAPAPDSTATAKSEKQIMDAYDEAIEHFTSLGYEPTEADREWARWRRVAGFTRLRTGAMPAKSRCNYSERPRALSAMAHKAII